MIEIYTDGGAHTDGEKVGGWGVVILGLKPEIVQLSGGAKGTTNNRMELIALLSAVKYILDHHLESEPIRITSDSQYVRNTVTTWMYSWAKRGWTNSSHEPVQNQDIIKVLFDLYPKLKQVDYNWVKGHAGNKFNELCDNLATMEQQKLLGQSPIDKTDSILESDPTYLKLNAMTKKEIIRFVIDKGFRIQE